MTLITSKTSEIVFIPSRKQATEIIPVAITSAKYPGNRSAAARESTFARALAIDHFTAGFFIASFAIEFEADAGGAILFSQNPGANSHRRIMPHVLAMAAS